MFFRKTKLARDPLGVVMSGVRLGERLLQVAVNDALSGSIAAKVGMSGRCAIAVADQSAATRAERVAADAAALVDIHVTPFDRLPFADSEFDVVVVHETDARLAARQAGARVAALRELHRVLRPSGRIVVIETGTQKGLSSLFRSAQSAPGPDAASGTLTALTSAGFRPVRQLADEAGLRFLEGART